MGAQARARQCPRTGCASTTSTACGWTPRTPSYDASPRHILAEIAEPRAPLRPTARRADRRDATRTTFATCAPVERAASASTRSGPTISTTRCGATWRATTRATTPTSAARSTRWRAASSRAGCTRASRRRSTASRRGTPAREQPAWQFVYVIQNHDQVGNRAFGDRLHHQVDLERYRGGVGAAAVPAVHADAVHGSGVRRVVAVPVLHRPQRRAWAAGDRGPSPRVQAFSAFADPPRASSIPDPQAEATFERSKLRLVEAERSRARRSQRAVRGAAAAAAHGPGARGPGSPID